MAGRREKIALVLSFVVALTTGCASIKSASERLGFGASGAKEGGTFFVGVDALPLRDAPNGSAKVIGELPLHQKVIRSKVDGGYALVRVVGVNLSGWVVNSKLLWKLPSSEVPAGEAPAAVEETPAPPQDSEESQAPPPEPTEQKEPARKSGTGASVFDPY